MKRFFLFVAALCCMGMMSLSARAQVMQVDKGRVIEVINLSQLRAALEDGDVIYEGKKSTLRRTDTVRIMKDITWKSRVLFFSAATCGTLNLDLNGHTLRRTLYDNHEYFQCALTISTDFFPYEGLVKQWAEDHSHDDQYEYKLNEHYGVNVLDVKVNIYDSKGNGKIICDNTIPDDDVRKRNNSVAVLINESPQDHFNNSLYGDNLFSDAEYLKYVWHYDGIYHDDNYFASFIEFNLYGGSLIGQMNGEEFYQQNLTSSQVMDYVDSHGKVHANYGLYNDNDFQYKENDPSTTVNVYGGYMTRLFTDTYLNLNMYGGQLGGEKTMYEYFPALIMGDQAEFRPYGVGLFAHFTDGILYGMTILAQQCYEEGNPTWTEWITDLEIGVSFGQGTRPMIEGEILTLDEWMDKICKHDEFEYNYKVEFVRDYSRVEIDGLVYKMDPANLTAVVIADKEEDESNYASLPSKVYVPATVNCANKTFKVTGIGDNAFYTCSAIQEIVLPESLVSVGDAAFYSCANLQHVSLPSSIRRIGKGAFWNCSELSEITIPQGVTAIPENTFNGCVKLEKVNLPTSVNTIGNAAFRGCALSKLILPEGVSSFGSGAFSACNNLHWVYNRRVTPQNISGKNVFGGITVSGIKLYVPFGCGEDYKDADVWGDFDIEEEHPKYGSLFYILDQNRLTAEVTYSSTGSDNYNTLSGKVVVPATITVDENEYQVIKIGTQAFASNTTIEEIELPEGIEEIAASAFSGAEALTKLNIPQSVKAIPNSIIYNSGIYNNDANYTNKCLYIDGCLLETKSDISGTVQVKEGTRLISGSAFAGRNSITSIRFPIALRYIGQNAFNSCTNLTEISIPEGVKEINRSTFVNCAKLENVKLPMSLEKIDNYAFSDCFNLQRIVIPANVQAIGKSAFDGSGVSQLEEVTLPAGIREIEESAFGNQSELKTIYIYAPDPSLMMLGENVFNLVDKEFCTFYVPYGSKALYMAADEWKDFKIEEMNPCIGGLYYSFNDEELTARVVCDQCNSDANYAALEGDVTIPATVIWNEKEYKVTVVSPNSFSYSPRITSLTFPSTISTIQYNSAEGCPSLVRVTIPSSVKKIEEYAFADCQKLYEINLPEGLEEIEERAFAGCENMTYIRIPSSLKTFGPYVFEGCSDIMEIYNFSETPQDIKDQYVFIDADPSMVTLYIPLGTESEYMNADVWQDFLIEEYKTVLSVTSEDENKGTVDGSGEYTRETIVEISATPEEGYVFDGWDDGEMQNPRKLLLDMDNIDIMASFTVKTFLVSFLDWDGSVLKSTMVNYNESAEAPENEPERDGYTFVGWDGDFSSVTEDLVITALYEMMETPIVIAGQKITPDMYNTMISGEGIEGDVFVTENGIFLNKGASIYMSDPSVPAIELTATDKVDKFIISGVDAQIFNSIVISGKAEVQFNGALPDGIEHDGPLSLKLGADVWWNTEHTIELAEGAQVKLILNGIESESNDSLTFYSESEAIHTPVGASCDIHAGGNVDFFIYNENCPVGYNDRTFTLHNTAMVLPYGGTVTEEGVLDAAGEEMFALRLSSNAPFIQSGKAYPIELFGVTVSEGNAADILGDGKASYDAETNTLTLDGMNLDYYEYQALRVVKSSINVEVKGENEFNNYSIRPAIEVESGDLRIFGDKDAKLHIDNYKSVVIRGDRTGKYRVAFEGCNVSVFASSGYTALEADSLYIDAANVSIGSQYDIAWRSMNPNKNGGLVLKHAVLKEGVVNVSPEMLFEPVPQYKVTFQDKDGNEIETQYVFEGEDAVAPEAPAVEGYTFTGWDKDFSAVKEDMVITAQYAINTYTVRFYDHSDNVISTQTVNWNEAAIEPELTPWEGHTFISWSAEFDHVKSDLDIKPIYDVEVYKVTFLGFNDIELKVEYVEYGYSATPPDAPEVEGYTFTGWDKEFDNVTSDLTVKAKYEINHYALTLVAGHGTIAITDESGEHSLNPDMIMHGTIVKLIVTADEGYQFTQWSDGNTDNPRTLVLTQDTSLVAHFEIIYLQPDMVTLCYGETYQWHGKTYDASGVYIDTLSSGVATLHLTILPQVEETIEEATICSGDTYTWQADGKEYAESGTYSVTLQDINGCDSVVILHLTVNPIATTEEHVTACDSYTWNGETYTQSGEYVYTTVAANGCDSIVTLHLTINNSEIGETEYATICHGETYTWNGQTYSTEGEYSITLSNTFGCDSVATLQLTIMPEATTTTETVVIGSDELPYTWRGNTYSATGRYTVVEQYTTVACDSAIHVLDLTVLTTGNHDEQSVTICETEAPYIWYGESYSATGKYTYTEKYVGTDIDSIQHILNLTVNPTVYTEEHITACDSYTWNGETYTQSGEYVYTTVAANGCDSIVTLHLTLNQSEHVEFSMTACDSYEWHGMTYTISGDYTYTTTTDQGCERVEVLHLTINKSEYIEESVTACDSYEWHGMTYTISGDYTYTTTTDQGCERVEVLHLTILPNATTESEELALCPSELPYEWYGQWLTEAGSYTASEQYAGMDCDSVIHELTVNVYVQTLPAAVTLPIVRTGEAIDVTIPTAEIQAHIAAETWYAPNAEVAWYIMENSDWAALTTEPVAAGTTQIVLKYAVATDCGSVESDNIVIDVTPTSVENTHTQSPTSDCQKILYEDHIYILREGKMYNAQGQKVQ